MVDEYSELKNQYEMQSALQREQMDSQTALNSSYNREQLDQIGAAVIREVNPTNVIDEIERVLKGEYKDEQTGEVKKKGRQLMNELGISKMITLCRGVISQNTTISSIEPIEVGNIMKEIQDDLVDDLSLNWKEYGIKEKCDLDTINNIVLIMCFMALKRAVHSGERNFLKTTTSEIINAKPSFNPQKQGGILSKLRL